tara:strand:- start:5499 stop:5807 length:309 start_codon:yes stop_codon:yes gene_type:complete
MRILGLLILMAIATQVQAEYRVYQYQVVSRFPGDYQAKPHVVTSTLDPVSYLAYHGGETSIAVDLMRSWTCVGHTGGLQDYCQSPVERAIAQEKQQTAEVTK